VSGLKVGKPLTKDERYEHHQAHSPSLKYSARLVLRRKYGKPVIQRINAHAYRGWSAKLSKNFHVINMGLRVEYYPRDGVNPFHNLYRITAIPSTPDYVIHATK
jgi:hypothetical protein